MTLILLFIKLKDKMLRTISGSHMNIFHGFMECLKLPNKTCGIYVIVKRNVSDNV